MQSLSIKIKTLLLFIVSIFVVASVSLAITVYKSNELGKVQVKEEEQLILDYNKNEPKA